MDDDDIFVGKFNARIVFGQPWIIPLFDFSQEQISQNVRGEFEFRGYSRNIVRRHISAKDGWDVKHFGGRLRKLFIRHGAITGAEIDGPGLNLLDAAAATNGLI